MLRRSTSVAPLSPGGQGGVGDRGQELEGGASSPAGEHGAPGCSAIALLWYEGEASRSNMSTDPDVQDGAVPPDAAFDAEGDADASPPASPSRSASKPWAASRSSPRSGRRRAM